MPAIHFKAYIHELAKDVASVRLPAGQRPLVEAAVPICSAAANASS
jgi:hypothetical protein